MTYLKLHQKFISWPLICLISFLALQVILTVFIYSKTVNFHYKLQAVQKSVYEVDAKNTEIKKQLFAILDFKDPKAFASQSNLIPDTKPEYLVSALH